MSTTTSCCTPCADPTTVNIPGAVGATGAAGAAGVDGVNAYTYTTVAFTVPAVNSSVTIQVEASAWGSNSQPIFIANAGSYQINSVPSATTISVKNLGYTGNVAPGTVIPVGSSVSPSGLKGDDGTDGASGAPSDATYIVQTANATLTNEQALSGLATGILKNTTGTGVLSIAVAGTDYLAADAELTAIAGLTSAANKVPYFTGSGAAALADLPAFGRTLIANANAADARTDLGVGSIATQAANSVAITGGSITGITDLAIADGGTGASTAAGARTALGLDYTTADLIIIEERQTAGTDGGTFTAAAWQTRSGGR